MKTTFLENILKAKKARVAAAKNSADLAELKRQIVDGRFGSERFRFRSALRDRSRINIIAEIKRASPSKGMINDSIDVVEIARSYEFGGACAISILTEEDFFKGSLDDLRNVRAATSLPILRKDFIFDEFQIYEAAEAGADAVLLIAAMLDNKALPELYCLAEQTLGLDALVEVHNAEELERAKNIGAKLIGVNNRDLKTFDVSLDVSRELIKHAPADAVMISESGLKTRDEISELRNLGYSGFLIGETLMRSGDPVAELQTFATEVTEEDS